jgi:NAD(P)H-dependent flavin oxidoreductase YrpB (nitropropane dioxygenase family)
MAVGPGKYDDLCTLVREQLGIEFNGGVALIVIGGPDGGGFSCQADLQTTARLPDLLERMAAQIRADLRR